LRKPRAKANNSGGEVTLETTLFSSPFRPAFFRSEMHPLEVEVDVKAVKAPDPDEREGELQ